MDASLVSALNGLRGWIAGEPVAKAAEGVARLEASALAEQRANDARALDHLDRVARILRGHDPCLTQAQAFAKACEENPDWYGRHVRHQQRLAARVDEIAIRRGRIAERQLDERAAAIAKNAGITHAQAVARVLDEHPELYERARAGQDALAKIAALAEQPQGHADMSRREAAESAIEKAADELRRANPSLTEQQAIAKALEADPELYRAYRAVA